MKKNVIFVLLLVFGWATSGWAVDCEFMWTPNSESNLAGYKIHHGQASADYSTSVDVGLPPTVSGSVYYTLSGFQPGITYYFAATAYDTDSFEGDYSQEIVWTVPSGDAMPPDGVVNFEIPGLSEMAAGDYKLTVNPDHSITVNALPDCPACEECEECSSCDEYSADSLDGLSSGNYEVVVYADGSHSIIAIGNSAPTISILVDSYQVIEGELVTITVTANDPENDPLIYDWYVDGVLYGSSSSIELTDLAVGSHSVYCQVDDGSNTINSSAVTITVLDGPHLSVPGLLTLTADYGDDEVSGNIVITNTGNGDMWWDVSTASSMLSFSSESGLNDSSVTVTVDLAGLEPSDDYYHGGMVVTSSDADNSPRTVQVRVIVVDVVENAMSIDLAGNSFLSIADESQTGLDLVGDFTFETQIKLWSAPGTNTAYTIVSKWGSGASTSESYIFSYRNNGGVNQLRGVVRQDGSKLSIATHNVTLIPGIWYDVALSYDISEDSFVFYASDSGNVVPGSALLTGIENSDAAFNLGRRASAINHFNGLMNNTRAWSEVRTASEIQTQLSGNETNLVGYWQFNDDLLDSTSNNNNLTNYGGIFSTDMPH
ncbi:hypothetical protein HOD96_00835 [Candidatus Falkowbacteria bacterium]|jgi:hypothetical protein|nr:hypothetical protein [Candidatus Falkowbacteria bacterium]MBT4433216.1 hypothetical protein [Candidatus Falkowbacteria bacterium]